MSKTFKILQTSERTSRQLFLHSAVTEARKKPPTPSAVGLPNGAAAALAWSEGATRGRAGSGAAEQRPGHGTHPKAEPGLLLYPGLSLTQRCLQSHPIPESTNSGPSPLSNKYAL